MDPRTLFLAVAFVSGLYIGSFLNVCLYRIPRGLSVVRPRSFCPACTKPIRWYHLIPVISFILLRGRCANCRAGYHCEAVRGGYCDCVRDTEGDCDDEEDDDLDGDTDCDDEDCEDDDYCLYDCERQRTCSRGTCPRGETCEGERGSCECVEERQAECGSQEEMKCYEQSCPSGEKCVALNSVDCRCIPKDSYSCDYIGDSSYCRYGECQDGYYCAASVKGCYCQTEIV
jgi:hypothetical protein